MDRASDMDFVFYMGTLPAIRETTTRGLSGNDLYDPRHPFAPRQDRLILGRVVKAFAGPFLEDFVHRRKNWPKRNQTVPA